MPVIAAMNGHALGGGAEVAVAADIRLAASDVRIGFSQVTLGIMPAWGGIERLVNLVGRSRALLAITSGTQYDATAAHAMGLIDLVIPRESFDEEWRSIAGRMATLAPGAARSMKAVVAAAAPAVRHDTRADAIDHFAHLWSAPAHWDAVAAAQQQRKG
jgi:enoyl-CoA hydratase/carnithine racemase